MAERQMATTIEEVRADHRLRYQFAIEQLTEHAATGHVVDAGCGVGYGSAMLADVVERVTSIEMSDDAHELYQKHWQQPNITFHRCDLLKFELQEPADAVVCFEFIEHIEQYEAAFEKISSFSDLLIISTPNEEVRPHLQEPVNPFHFRHFRPREIAALAEKNGMRIDSWHCQKSGKKPDIAEGTNGKFIIAVCRR